LFTPPSKREKAAVLRAAAKADKRPVGKRSWKRNLAIGTGAFLAFVIFVGLVTDDPNAKRKTVTTKTTLAVVASVPPATVAVSPATTLDTTPKATEPPETTPPDTTEQTVAVPVANAVPVPSEIDQRAFRRDAFEVCKRIVKSNLKSPSTAKFRNVNEDDGEVLITNYTEPDQWDVNSTVDSENSFGGTVRTRFSCSLNYIGGQFSFVNFEFIE
jgi:hypothetical protein